MALTDKDIALFARDAVFADATTSGLRCSNAKAALTFFEAAQASVRDSGYRVTQRVKNLLWAELERIGAAPCEA